jgi:hypothetical protein
MMNSQTQTVMIASLIGLVLAISSKASSVISTGNITPLDTLNPFNLSILGYWIGTLGFFPLTFIVFAVAATARTAGLRNSVFNGLGAVVGVSLTITGVVIAVATAHPKKEFPDRASLVKNATSSCIKNQQIIPKNKDVSVAIIEAFCSCYGDSLADVTTVAEVMYADQHQIAAPTMIEKINTTVQKCMQLVPDP